jgi:magnesium-transporting ATPase (P-type)
MKRFKASIVLVSAIIISIMAYYGIADFENEAQPGDTSFSFGNAIVHIENGQLLFYLSCIVFFAVYAVVAIKQKFKKMSTNISLLISTGFLIMLITFFSTRANWMNESAMKPEEVRMSLQALFLILIAIQILLIGFLIVTSIKIGELNKVEANRKMPNNA